MQTVDNYYEDDRFKHFEKQYQKDLEMFYGILLVRLNDVKTLTETEIKRVIKEWKDKYQDEVDDTVENHVKRLRNISNNIIPSENSASAQDKLQERIIASNKRELEITTDEVQLNFNKLATYEKDINYSSEIADEKLQSIARQAASALGLFTAMSTIGAMREFTFTNAESNGYTEYLWVTQRDSKVRPEHAAMDGKWIAFDDPSPQPAGLHVGQDYNCRCYIGGFR
jgi:SPP1 gp7 family putative phage head morphogenesis protein